MQPVEDELKRALRRKPAPPDLLNRVMASLPNEPETGWRRLRGSFSGGWLRWTAATAGACLILLFALFQYDGILRREAPAGSTSARETTAKGEQARREVLLALHITGSQLQAIQEAVKSSGSPVRDRNEN